MKNRRWKGTVRSHVNAHKGSGFTLLEMMITLAVVGIILAMGVPMFQRSSQEIKLESAAEEIVIAIRYAQALAMKTGVQYKVVFEPIGEKITCKEIGNIALHPLDKRPYVIDFSIEGPFKGIDVISADFSGTPDVTYNPTGEVVNKGSVKIGYLGMTRTITVTAPMGKVEVQ